MTTDWRLRGQEEWLTGGCFRHADYRAWSETWDHDHCEMCNLKLSERAGGERTVTSGWQSEDEYRWLCDECFADFRERFGLVVITDDTPKRRLEFHDAVLLELSQKGSVVTVHLEAFVHDDDRSVVPAGVWQRIDLEFGDASFEHRRSGEEPWASTGSLCVDDKRFDYVLTIPLRRQGNIVFSLTGVYFDLTVHARRVVLKIVGAPADREP